MDKEELKQTEIYCSEPGILTMKELVKQALEVLDDSSQKRETLTGIPTGFLDLDRKLGGLKKGNLILLGSRPSMGKSALASNIAQYVSQNQGIPVAYFSMQMPSEELVYRMLTAKSMTRAFPFKHTGLSDEGWERLLAAADALGNAKMILDDTKDMTVAELRRRCRRYRQEYGTEFVIVDDLQLMIGMRDEKSRRKESAKISLALKEMAEELNIPVLVLTQLSRSVEKRQGSYIPMLMDIQDTGTFERDADVVMFLYRDEYYHSDTVKKGIADILIAKQRNGPLGHVELAWIPEYLKFTDLPK